MHKWSCCESHSSPHIMQQVLLWHGQFYICLHACKISLYIILIYIILLLTCMHTENLVPFLKMPTTLKQTCVWSVKKLCCVYNGGEPNNCFILVKFEHASSKIHTSLFSCLQSDPKLIRWPAKGVIRLHLYTGLLKLFCLAACMQ